MCEQKKVLAICHLVSNSVVANNEFRIEIYNVSLISNNIFEFLQSDKS